MDENTLIFTPINSSDLSYFWIALFFALVTAALLVRSYFKPIKMEKNRRIVLEMLFFFGFLLSMGTAFFSGLSSSKTGTIIVGEASVEIGRRDVDYTTIKKAFLHEDLQKSFVNPSITRKKVQLLFIEQIDGKTEVLSELDYDVEAIFRALESSIAAWKANK